MVRTAVRGTLLGALAFVCSVAGAEDVRNRVNLGRNCSVYRRPSLDAPVVCRAPKGAEVFRNEPTKTGYYEIEIEGCVGYVTDSCLSFERRRWEGRSPTSAAGLDSGGVRLALALDGVGLFGRAADVSSTGYGVGGGVMVSFPLGPRFRLAVVPQYRYMELGLSVDGTGVIQDTPGQYTHRIPHAGLGVMGSFLLSGFRAMGREPAWWLDAGAEYLIPLSARQVDRLGNVVPFEPTDRPVFLFAGVSGDFMLGDKFSLVSYLHLLYNVAATGSSRLLAGRFTLAFTFHL